MKRRSFIKGLLSLTAIPIVARANIEPEVNPEGGFIGRGIVAHPKFKEAQKAINASYAEALKEGINKWHGDARSEYLKRMEDAIEKIGSNMRNFKDAEGNKLFLKNGSTITFK